MQALINKIGTFRLGGGDNAGKGFRFVSPPLADAYPDAMFTPVTPSSASIFLRFISRS